MGGLSPPIKQSLHQYYYPFVMGFSYQVSIFLPFSFSLPLVILSLRNATECLRILEVRL